MGKQPETEDQIEEPISGEQIADEDVEITTKIDLSLPCQDHDIDGIDPEQQLAMCQICMDFFGAKEVVRNVCGPQCLAEVCPGCLTQHLTASVYSFYPGVLPKMRCPVCLVLLNKSQWKRFVAKPAPPAPVTAEANGEEANQQQQETTVWQMDNSHVLDKYEILCRQSCGFQAPCCHNAEYTMLTRVREDTAAQSPSVTLPSSQAALLPELSRLYRDYCFHRIEAGELYDFLMDSFGANVNDLLELLVENTVDDERRANLLLLDLFHNPDTYTSCCGHAVCFKCKSAEHHDGECGDFVVDESVLDCPGCRVTLVKVDGCDSVTCLCGQTIEWPLEMEKQRLQRKQLAPEDNRVYKQWRQWASQLDGCLGKIEALATTLRTQRLQRMLRDHRDVLQELVERAVRRARLNILIRQHGDRLGPLVRAHLERRKATATSNDTVVKTDTAPTETAPTSLCIAPAA